MAHINLPNWRFYGKLHVLPFFFLFFLPNFFVGRYSPDPFVWKDKFLWEIGQFYSIWQVFSKKLWKKNIVAEKMFFFGKFSL